MKRKKQKKNEKTEFEKSIQYVVIKNNDKMWAIQNFLLIINKILHIIIAVIHNAKEEDILDTLKIKKSK